MDCRLTGILRWYLIKMGKSDPVIFEEYLNVIEECNTFELNAVAFLGFSGENDLTRRIFGKTRHFYDRSLGNWEINSDWVLQQKYDLIVCTRCAYFSKDPKNFVKNCLNHAEDGGHLLMDWGLGDHWRFPDYKVGWVRNGKREFAYSNENFLYSCFWRDSLVKDEQVKLFWQNVLSMKNSPYSSKDDLAQVIKSEVPVLIDYKTKELRTRFLWPEKPQLYIITLVDKY